MNKRDAWSANNKPDFSKIKAIFWIVCFVLLTVSSFAHAADISDQEFVRIKVVLNMPEISDQDLRTVLSQEVKPGVTLGSQMSAVIAQLDFGSSLWNGSYYLRYQNYFNNVINENTGLAVWQDLSSGALLDILTDIVDMGTANDLLGVFEALKSANEILDLWSAVVSAHNDAYLREYIAGMDSNGGNDQDAWDWLEPGIIGVKEDVHTYFRSAWKAYAAARNYNKIIDEFRKLLTPTITYTPTNPNAPTEISFSVSGRVLSQMNISTYAWDFGDGQTGSGQSISHYYKIPQTYTVTLTLTDSSGGTHVYSESAVVSPPEINITYPDGYESLKRHFSTPSSSHAANYAWTYGDGSPPENNRNGDHTYASTGYYTVSLTITLDDNSTIQSQTGIFVGPGVRYIQGHTIYGHETWYSGGTYVVEGTINVAAGAMLTIESGVTVKLASGAQINSNGTLNATAATFTRADGVSSWNGIAFLAGSSNSKLQDCVIEHTAGTVVYIAGASVPVIKNNSITGTADYGILVDSNSAPVVTGNTISGNVFGISILSNSSGIYQGNTITWNTYGIYAYYSANNPVLSGNAYSHNISADLLVGGTINTATNWSEIGDYTIQGLTISNGASLAIASGGTVKFNNGASINVNGTLTATGVKFTWADGQNPWGGIIFSGEGSNSSVLSECVIEHSGGTGYWSNEAHNTAVIYIDAASPSIADCTIRNSTAQSGIFLNRSSSPTIKNSNISGFTYGNGTAIAVGLNTFFYGSQSQPTVIGNTLTGNRYGVSILTCELDCENAGTYQGNTISGNSEYGISYNGLYGYASQSSDPLITGNSYANNGSGDVFWTGNINTMVNWSDALSYVTSSLSIKPNAKLNISSDKTIKLTNGATVTVDGTLTATRVKFTWADVGNLWGGIIFTGANSISKLDNCIIEHSNGTHRWSHQSYNLAVIYIESASPTINSCSINQSTAMAGIYIFDNGAQASPVISNNIIHGFSSGVGITIDNDYFFIAATSTPVVTGNTITDNNYGIDTRGGGTYTSNTFSGNAAYGLFYSGSGLLNATNNNWGHPSGPKDTSDDRATGGLYNPNGLGDRVSDHVNYYPWVGSNTLLTAKPTGLAGTHKPDINAMNLTWNANTEPYLTGYKIYYGTTSGVYTQTKTVGTVTSALIDSLSNTQPYYFAISSLNALGSESPKSDEISLNNLCLFVIGMVNPAFANGGGNGHMNVNGFDWCNWTAVSNNDWITVTSGNTGTGNGIVNFTVAANLGNDQRTGTITVAGGPMYVTQAGISQSVLTVTKYGTGNGTVTADTGSFSWNSNIGTASYNPAATVTISASPDTKSNFAGWIGDCLGNGSSCAVSMSIPKFVRAAFNSKADFNGTPTNGSLPLTVSFTDASTHSPTSWSWDFGDGGTSISQNPLHTYKTSGFYAVSLTALGIGGAIDVIKDKYIFVSACNNQPIRIGGTNYYYQKIQDALESSLLSGDVVQMLALDRPEAINLQQNVSIVLSGGYSCDYVSHLGFTTINGSLTIKDGKATVENLIIK